jgi:multicomponent K+:H+ antiporter subunit A
VALVQIVVDILAVVILVLALTRLPRAQRRRAQQFTFLQSRSGLVRDGLIAGGIGLVVTAVTLIALLSRPRQSVVTPFYAENAKPLAGATDIVGAIIVDFRALDTFIEIAVFSMAGVGIYTLLRHAARKFGDEDILEIGPLTHRLLPTNGIGGGQTSAFVRALAHLALPLSFLLALTHMMYGHDQPGDGFTAGVIISLAIGFWYVAFGYERTRQQLGWLKSAWLIGSGLLLVVVNGTIAALLNGHFLSPVNFGERWGLPLPQGFYLSTAFLFEVAICLAVVGSVTYMINTLGHPGPRAGEETYEEETAVVAPSPPGGNGGNGYRTPREETAVTES